MKINVIAIGDELLAGQVVDTNSSFIARSLGKYGWELNKVRVISDKENDIISSVTSALKETDVVVTTGGLGPTKDDITKTALMRVFGGKLVENKEVELNVREIFGRRGISMNKLTATQWQVPDSCKVIMNRYGTAPVFWFEQAGKVLVSLPGVPFEMKGCWDEEVMPKLLSHFGGNEKVIRRTLYINGISESKLAEHLNELEQNFPKNIHLAYLPGSGFIRLRLDGNIIDSENDISDYDSYFETLKKSVSEWLLWDGDILPSKNIFELLKNENLTLSTAESCTGGRIASEITAFPGSSSIFKGGVVAYSNFVKLSVLGVRKDILDAHGAVSIPVVEDMATGVADITNSDCSIATSGIAGPDGGTPEKPVGTVCIAVKYKDRIIKDKFIFSGTRTRIMECAVNTGFIMLFKLINNTK